MAQLNIYLKMLVAGNEVTLWNVSLGISMVGISTHDSNLHQAKSQPDNRIDRCCYI
jgi:hypothetical protein